MMIFLNWKVNKFRLSSKNKQVLIYTSSLLLDKDVARNFKPKTNVILLMKLLEEMIMSGHKKVAVLRVEVQQF